MAYKEIFNILETAGTMAINLSNQINNPQRDYSLGTNDKPTTNKSK